MYFNVFQVENFLLLWKNINNNITTDMYRKLKNKTHTQNINKKNKQIYKYMLTIMNNIKK